MKRIMFTLFTVLTVAFALIGCGLSPDPEKSAQTGKPAVCFVIANTANSQGINFKSPLVQDTLLDCAGNYGFVAVVNADGDSEVLIGESMDIDDKYKKASSERLKMDARNKANNLLNFMQNVTADDPDVDFLEALRLGCRTLSSLEGYSSRNIIVLGTGLSNTGYYMNFANNLISAEPEDVADLLEEKEAIPDFSSITGVYWQGLADTAAPQQALTPAQRSKLQDIWSAVVRRGGSELIPNDFISNPVDETAVYPSMSVVDLPDEDPVIFDPKELEEETAVPFEEPMVLSEEEVAFIPGKAEYLYPEEAAETLAPIAAYLVQHEQVAVLLAGTTAGDDTNDYTLELSAERANCVKNTLIELGVNTERITAVGLASSDPWHVSGAGLEGSIPASNRKVVVMDVSSETARHILEDFDFSDG